MKRRPLTLVPDPISHETVECLQQLLEQAQSGRLRGLAFAAILQQNQYIVNTAGIAYEDPTLSRGMVRALDDELGRKVWG